MIRELWSPLPDRTRSSLDAPMTDSIQQPRECASLLDLIGNTPLLRIGVPLLPAGHGFWAKLEGCNPGGIKDRAALALLQRARVRGELQPGATIIESTSGTLGLGLALVGIALGHPVVLVADPGLEPLMQRLLTAYGARLEIVTEPHPTGGWQEARRQRLQAVQAGIPHAYWTNQYDNPDNALGYTALGNELLAQLDRIDVLVCSVGTGGHSAGVAQMVRRVCPHVRIVGVDSIGSTIFGQPARSRLMRGLGSSIYPRNVAYAMFDEVHWVNPGEAVAMCRMLARSCYVTGGWSTGAVAVVAAWYARVLAPDQRIVTIFPDGPHRYWNTIYDDAYCREHGLLDHTIAAHPDEIAHPQEHEVRRWTRCVYPIDPLTQPAVTVEKVSEDAAYLFN